VWGLPCPSHYCDSGALLPHLFTLTSMLPPGRYIFCGTFRHPGLNLDSRTLSGTLLCGVRTFLPSCDERPSGPAANMSIIADGRLRTPDIIVNAAPVSGIHTESQAAHIWQKCEIGQVAFEEIIAFTQFGTFFFSF